MIRVVDRHIGLSAIAGMLAALLVLASLDAFFALISELGDLGKGDYDLGDVIQYVVLTTPRRAWDLFPTAAVVGAMLGVGGLAASSELIAYRSAGLSRLRIAGAVVLATALLLIPITILGEWVAPGAERVAQVLRIREQSVGVAMAQDAGLWVRDGSTVVHARRPVVGNVAQEAVVQLADIDVFEFENDELRYFAHAELGEHRDRQWHMSNVVRSRFEAQRVLTSQAADELWTSLLDPALLRTAVARPRHLALAELWPYVAYLEKNGLDAHAYASAIWIRLTYPLSALVVVFAAMPFLFGNTRGGGLGQRLFLGMLVGTGFYLANRTAQSLSDVYHLSPPLTALAPALLLAGLTTWVLRRARA